MHAGAASVLVARFDAEEAVRLIDRHGITHVSDFPPVLTTLLDAAGEPGSPAVSPKNRSRPRSPPTPPPLHAQPPAPFLTGFRQTGTNQFVTPPRARGKPGAPGK